MGYPMTTDITTMMTEEYIYLLNIGDELIMYQVFLHQMDHSYINCSLVIYLGAFGYLASVLCILFSELQCIRVTFTFCLLNIAIFSQLVRKLR